METLDGQINEIDTEDLKAVFFVKSHEGDRSHKKTYDDHVVGGGRKIKVSFTDGEEIVGFTMGYSPDRPGFMIIPADSAGNTDRIFVVRSSTKKIEFI